MPPLSPLARAAAAFPAKAKHAIFLFMNGAPSQVDTFDPKPALDEAPRPALPRRYAKVGSNGRPIGHLMQSPFPFRQHGQSGLQISSLFPHTARFADDLCVIRSMYTDTAAHASGCLQMNTGSVLIGKPSLGSWLSYGLGTLNENLPSFVVMTDPRGGPIGSASNWTAGYMPAAYQGTLFRSRGRAAARPGHARRHHRRTRSAARSTCSQRSTSEHLARHAGRVGAGRPHRVATSWPTACRRRRPTSSTSTAKTQATQEMYGLNDTRHRRLRPQVPDHAPAARTRRALRAALFRRRPPRGHLGRPHRLHHQPHAARRRDRPADRRPDHRPEARPACGTRRCSSGAASSAARRPAKASASRAATTTGTASRCGWPAPACKGGQAIGATDELGFNAVEDRCHVSDLHATILHLMGLDHQRLTYFYQGLDQRLTGVIEERRVLRKVLA